MAYIVNVASSGSVVPWDRVDGWPSCNVAISLDIAVRCPSPPRPSSPSATTTTTTTTIITTTTTATAAAAVNAAAAAPTSPQNELDLPQIAVKSEMNLIHVRRAFPGDFMFQLTSKETTVLRSQIATGSPQAADSQRGTRNQSQIATGSQKHRDPRLRPYAFTEYGALTAANILNSPRAVQMNTRCGDAVGWTALVAW